MLHLIQVKLQHGKQENDSLYFASSYLREQVKKMHCMNLYGTNEKIHLQGTIAPVSISSFLQSRLSYVFKNLLSTIDKHPNEKMVMEYLMVDNYLTVATCWILSALFFTL